MSAGTGLFVLGAWLVVVAAYATDKVTVTGVRSASRAAWLATLIGVAITFAEKFA